MNAKTNTAAAVVDLNRDLSLPRIVSIQRDVLPPRWERFADKNKVRLHVALLSENAAGTGKLWPATNILAAGIARNEHGGARKAIDSTSGGYGVAMATAIKLSRERDLDFPIENFVAVVSRSLPSGKRAALEALGIELLDASDAIEAMRVAEEAAAAKGYWYTRQYWNPDNSAGYRRVAKHIAATLPEIGLVAWGVGSGGGCSGVMPVLSEAFKDRPLPLRRIAVVVEDGHKVGGVRDEVALEPGTLNWRAPNIDGVRIVGQEPAYGFSAALWRQPGLTCGPSTGFSAEGAMLAARELVILRTLDQYRADDGYVHMLIPSLDTRDPYREEYAQRSIFF